MSARKKKGSKYLQTPRKKYASDIKRQLSKLSSTLTEMKASIAAFIGKPQRNSSSEAKIGQAAPVSGDAGNSFGGCASKRTKAWLEIPLSSELFGLMLLIEF